MLDAFSFYDAYHTNKVNQAIHLLFVPAIYTTALVFLQKGVPLSVPPAAAGLLSMLRFPAASAALPVALGYAGFYLYLSPTLLGASAAALALGAVPLAGAWCTALGPRAVTGAVALHVAAWLAQFYGHGAHEGRSPALLDNLVQALVMAPMFVWTEALMALGFLKGFKAAVEPIIEKKVAEFKAKKTG